MGPKKGGAIRGPPKTQKKQQSEISIDDFVAAGDSKSKSRSSDKSSNKQGPGKDGSNESASEQQKKPTTRSVIGGASWTGKLPVNMLAEHCQKQRWEKPEYTMVGIRLHNTISHSLCSLTTV